MRPGPVPGEREGARPAAPVRAPGAPAPDSVPDAGEGGRGTPPIQHVYAALAADEERNGLIFDDVLQALEAGRSPILLTERKDHAQHFADRLDGFARNVLLLRGRMGVRQRREVMRRLKDVSDTEERVLIATGRYIGEGFDDAR